MILILNARAPVFIICLQFYLQKLLTNQSIYVIIRHKEKREVITMLYFLCTIPAAVGWMLVGVLAVVIAATIAKIIVTIIRDKTEEEGE